MPASLPGIISTLQLLGGIAIAATAGCLFGTFVMDSDIYRAFMLGAFFTGLLGIVLLFGLAKVIELLAEIREQGKPAPASQANAESA